MPPSIPISTSIESCAQRLRRDESNAKRRVKHGQRKHSRMLTQRENTTRTTDGNVSARDNVSNDAYYTRGSSVFGMDFNSNSNSIPMMPMSPGIYGSPYYGAPMMNWGPLGGAQQLIFGVQNMVFSVIQATQVLGANQEMLQHAFESLSSMLDQAIRTFHDLRALDMRKTRNETPEEKRRRQRLKTLRWALLVGSSWLLGKLIRRLADRKQRKTIRYAPRVPREDYWYKSNWTNPTPMHSTTNFNAFNGIVRPQPYPPHHSNILF